MTELAFIRDSESLGYILLDKLASATEKYAAKELNAHFERITGVELPVEVTGSAIEYTDKPSILIGRTAYVEELLGDFDWLALGEDGVVVITVNNRLILAGATPRGSLYAVYEFLERELGCRWLTPDCTVIPTRPSIVVSEVNHLHVPAFRYREVHYASGWDADWTVRQRLNGNFAPLDAVRGGQWSYAGFVHTFYELVPPEQYFEAHPEYYSEEILSSGERRRTASHAQLCLTNPDVVDVVMQRVTEWLDQQPQARIVSISQNDWNGYCQCAACSATDSHEGSPSGALIRFVNAVAERLEEKYPHVFFDTLAYTYTVEPPRHARPRHNVIVRLCHMNHVCDSHPLEKCGINAPYVDLLRQWCAISPEVFIWDYFTNFYHYFMPFPNLNGIAADIPLYAAAGVTGIFCQADGTPPQGPGALAELRAYLLARLLWNPLLDAKDIIQEFIDGYYGHAGPAIAAYNELLHKHVHDKPIHLNLYSPLGRCEFTHDFLTEAERLLDEAEAQVEGNATLRERVAAARLPLEYIWWKHNLVYKIKGLRYEAEPDTVQRTRRFFEVAMTCGAQALYERGRTLADEVENLLGFDLLKLETGRLKLLVAPQLGGRIISLVDTRSGYDWMRHASPLSLGYPFSGGYEEYSEVVWRSPGWKENYSAEADNASITMVADLENGLKLQRVITIEGAEAVAVESTLINSSKHNQDALLRTHGEFALQSPDDTLAWLCQVGGDVKLHAPWRQGAASGDIWFEGVDKPAGRWGLKMDVAELHFEFEPLDVDRCLLSWSDDEHAVRFDTYGAAKRLKPGESTTIRQRWCYKQTSA